MKKHLLLEKAYVYPLPKATPEMSGYKFDHRNGYWVTEETGEPFVFDKSNPGPRSKKCDIETGEDADLRYALSRIVTAAYIVLA